MFHRSLDRRAPNRSRHFALAATLACSLPLSLTPALLAQSPAPDLLTPISSWQSPEDLKSTVAIEGLQVEMHSKVLADGAPHFSFQGFNGTVYQADLERLKHNDLGAVTWVGKISEFGEHSEVLLSTYEGAVAGIIDTPDGRYEIDPTPDGHVLMKLDASRFGGCGTEHPGHRHPVPAADVERAAHTIGLKPEAVTATANPDKATYDIDIGVVFSAEVVDEYGSQSNALVKATAAIDILDTAFSQSDIDADANFLAHTFLSEGDLGDFSGGEDGAILVMLSDGSEIVKSDSQDWYLNHPELEGISKHGDNFGHAMAAGDFNNDSYQDLAIGIPDKDIEDDSNTGAVLILYGTANGLSSARSEVFHQDRSGVLGGNEDGDRFGYSLAVGNFDGDNFDDLAIGRPFEDFNGKDDTGAISVLYGHSNGLRVFRDQNIYQSTLGQIDEHGDEFGYSLATGDFNGDQIEDLAVSAHREDHSGANSAGQVTVIYGSTNGLDTDSSATFSQETPGVDNRAESWDNFGNSLAVGNFDGDGYDDLVVGVPDENWDGDDSGLIHVLFGTTNGLTGSGSQTFTQNDLGDQREAGDHFGFALAVGYFDNDAYSDLAVSAPFEGADNKGRVHFLFGSNSGLTADTSYELGSSGDQFGRSLATGDFDGDGDHDLAVGLPSNDDDENAAGRVDLYHLHNGQPTFKKSWHQDNAGTVSERESDDRFGTVLVAADFDGDGDSDLAIGVPDEGVSNDLDYFEDWMGGSDQVAALRTTDGADLVGLLVEHASNYCGSAQKVLSNPNGDASVFYQVTARSCAVGNMSFAHEFGHLLGLSHDPDNASDSGACTNGSGEKYGRGHYVNGRVRTIMSYEDPCTSGCTRRMFFSNPDVNFGYGGATGRNKRDNARCANVTVPFVAAYY